MTSDRRSGEPHPGPAPDDGAPLRRYEMWVKTVISPVLLAALPVRAEPATVPRRTLRRLRIAGARDVPAVLRRLAESGIEVLDIRGVGGSP